MKHLASDWRGGFSNFGLSGSLVSLASLPSGILPNVLLEDALRFSETHPRPSTPDPTTQSHDDWEKGLYNLSGTLERCVRSPASLNQFYRYCQPCSKAIAAAFDPPFNWELVRVAARCTEFLQVVTEVAFDRLLYILTAPTEDILPRSYPQHCAPAKVWLEDREDARCSAFRAILGLVHDTESQRYILHRLEDASQSLYTELLIETIGLKNEIAHSAEESLSRHEIWLDHIAEAIESPEVGEVLVGLEAVRLVRPSTKSLLWLIDPVWEDPRIFVTAHAYHLVRERGTRGALFQFLPRVITQDRVDQFLEETYTPESAEKWVNLSAALLRVDHGTMASRRCAVQCLGAMLLRGRTCQRECAAVVLGALSPHVDTHEVPRILERALCEAPSPRQQAIIGRALEYSRR
jgi:hypothetical protein